MQDGMLAPTQVGPYGPPTSSSSPTGGQRGAATGELTRSEAPWPCVKHTSHSK